MSDLSFVGLVTVRVSSTRLPEKCLLRFGEMNMLQHIIRRCTRSGISPIVCTSLDPSDDVLEEIAIQEGIPVFRGSLKNKLKRWADCAEHFGLPVFHTVDADDPFFDTREIERSMLKLLNEGLDMVYPSVSSSAGGASVGYSLTSDIVRRAADRLDEEKDTEMMWKFIENLPDVRADTLEESEYSVSNLRLTLDYAEDYWLLESVRRILGNFAERGEVNELFLNNPDLYKINWFRNKEWKDTQEAKLCDE